ncbi:glycine cleavage system protein R [Rheinheimera mesophila]|uniref:Glycine cleavage system transcriptional repressor n=1 Tax=Rheinheimera mesophila TaxID=1547515 RepID=A0A3P3QL60_9GAMM|nr:ACT domain-containing protein [Rheinheimera mesophila]KKL02913.1 glycine cleavage system protein R [Rheinheimera mesophila]RRJ21093.1 glycine cleavage system protein R [Rheinheimera mesophila]
MKQLILTVIGQDKAGLVEQLATVISSHQGNWMASNLSHLGGYFAGILQLEVPEEHLFALTTELERMSDLDIKIQQGLDSQMHPDKQLQFVITGNDRPGIVRELSSVIKHKGANITHFESSKQSAPNWGVPLFHAIATVELPAGLNKDEVVKALEAIASDVVVDVEH